MNYHCANLCLVSLIFGLLAPHCWCFSAVQVKKTTKQLSVLPKVTCSARRIRAVFGPLVRSNIHVKGKGAFFVTFKLNPRDGWQTLSQYKLLSKVVLLRFDRLNRGHNPSPPLWGLLWSDTEQRQKPEPLLPQQIWQLLCTHWGKIRGSTKVTWFIYDLWI